MPLEAPLAPAKDRASELNRRYANHSAAEILHGALSDPAVGRLAMVSSFGAESVVLLHLLSTIDRTTPVLFIDTEMLFHETLTYQRDLAEKLRLNVKVIGPDRSELMAKDPDAMLHRRDPDACCALRKTAPLARALEGYEGWITGRKRAQTADRAAMQLFEAEGPRIKVNPLAHFTISDVQDYITNNRLPRHPLVARGFSSLGCTPCTTKVKEGEDLRAGRWRGKEKVECGIHFENGRLIRTGDAA